MGKQALEGVKIADFCWGIAGPVTCKLLVEHGATSIRIESTARPDVTRTNSPYRDGIPGMNRSYYFANYGDNRYGITVNLKHPRGIELARRIIAWADIVAENFTPGVMERLGLGYEEVRRDNPQIIYVSSSGQGQTGPHARHASLGLQLTALCGYFNLTGWPDRAPSIPFGAYTDLIAPRFALVAVVAALDHRRRTGHGQRIDVSQYEAAIQLLAPAILDFGANGRGATRVGNRSACGAPHGAYPCRGHDEWCTIAVLSDDEWEAFARVAGNLPWTRDSRFASLLGRKQNEDEIDALVAGWSLGFTAEEVMMKLQAAGVSAGVVQACEGLASDPQLAERHQFWELEHPEFGSYRCDTGGFRLSETPMQITMPAPSLGEHNHYVCTDILGMSDQEFVELAAQGIFE